jgi:hypothetical protein
MEELSDPGKQIVDSEVTDKYGDLPVVIKDFVVVAEVMSDEGLSLLVSTSATTTPWTVFGLLRYANKFFDDQFYNPNFNPDVDHE